jgi:hypothetical protein
MRNKLNQETDWLLFYFFFVSTLYIQSEDVSTSHENLFQEVQQVHAQKKKNSTTAVRSNTDDFH